MKAKLNILSIISQSCRNVKLVKNGLLKWINGVRSMGTCGYAGPSGRNRPSWRSGGGRFITIISLIFFPKLVFFLKKKHKQKLAYDEETQKILSTLMIILPSSIIIIF